MDATTSCGRVPKTSRIFRSVLGTIPANVPSLPLCASPTALCRVSTRKTLGQSAPKITRGIPAERQIKASVRSRIEGAESPAPTTATLLSCTCWVQTALQGSIPIARSASIREWGKPSRRKRSRDTAIFPIARVENPWRIQGSVSSPGIVCHDFTQVMETGRHLSRGRMSVGIVRT